MILLDGSKERNPSDREDVDPYWKLVDQVKIFLESFVKLVENRPVDSKNTEANAFVDQCDVTVKRLNESRESIKSVWNNSMTTDIRSRLTIARLLLSLSTWLAVHEVMLAPDDRALVHLDLWNQGDDSLPSFFNTMGIETPLELKPLTFIDVNLRDYRNSNVIGDRDRSASPEEVGVWLTVAKEVQMDFEKALDLQQNNIGGTFFRRSSRGIQRHSEHGRSLAL